jgi:hypothetical protein
MPEVIWYARVPGLLELAVLREEAIRELVGATLASSAPDRHRRDLARLVQRLDAELDDADSDEQRLARRQHVAAGVGLTPKGSLRGRPGGRPREVVRGPQPTVVART